MLNPRRQRHEDSHLLNTCNSPKTLTSVVALVRGCPPWTFEECFEGRRGRWRFAGDDARRPAALQGPPTSFYFAKMLSSYCHSIGFSPKAKRAPTRPEGNDGGGDGGGTLYHHIGKPANYNAQSDNNLSFHHAFHKGARLWAIHECAWNVHDSPFIRAIPLGVTTRSQTRARVVPWDTWRACGRGGRHPGRRARRTPSPG